MSPDGEPDVLHRDPYPLNRDLLASARLHLQHAVVVNALGYLLHPAVPVGPTSLVADIATGTGIFALALAAAHPEAHIEASDIDLAQVPAQHWWPENATFAVLDVFQNPLPAPLLERYDILCLRHFVSLQPGDPRPLIAGLLSMLRPGGYLHWQEWDLTTATVVAPDGVSTPRMQALIDYINDATRHTAKATWVGDLHQRVTAGEVPDVELVAYDRVRAVKPAVVAMQQELMVLGTREVVASLRAREGEASVEAAKFENIANDAVDECLGLGRGPVIDQDIVTWVLRKK
jgi:SAM-dependent methyltransferase